MNGQVHRISSVVGTAELIWTQITLYLDKYASSKGYGSSWVSEHLDIQRVSPSANETHIKYILDGALMCTVKVELMVTGEVQWELKYEKEEEHGLTH